MLAKKFTPCFLLCFTFVFSNGCSNSSSLDSLSPFVNQAQANDNWLITGGISQSGFENGEIIALGLDGTKFRSAIVQGNFGIELPGNATYALHFLPKTAQKSISISASDFLAAMPNTSNTNSVGAQLTFEESPEIGTRDTLRLPRISRGSVLNLGEIDIQGERAYPAINPALNLDFDSDGISDFKDPDDQNDDLPDNKQKQQLESVDVCTSGNKTEKVSLSELLGHLERGANIGSCGFSDVDDFEEVPQDTQLSDLAIAPESDLAEEIPEELPPASDLNTSPEIPVRNQEVIIEPSEDDEEENDDDDVEDDEDTSAEDDDDTSTQDDDDNNNQDDDDNSTQDDDDTSSQDDDDSQ